MSLTFELAGRDGTARAGLVKTPRGEIHTPAFMPVGTAATVKAMSPEEVRELGAEVILCNTYHLMLRPGADRVERLGGLHRFMGWPHPILTDSGGFQVYSLAGARTVSAEGVEFRSHLDGSRHFLGPREALSIQARLGSDIAMVLDECPPLPSRREDLEAAVERTLSWARTQREIGPAPGQALFGIVQGGLEMDLRARCAGELISLGFDGYAIGGLSVGEEAARMYQIARATAALLPVGSPRYLMGVGTPADLLTCVGLGIDMFDCVLPTRTARNGLLWTRQGRLVLKNAIHAEDPGPPDPTCSCYTCRRFSRAYLRHLHLAGEILGARLATLHNLHFYLSLMREARLAILEGRFQSFRQTFDVSRGAL